MINQLIPTAILILSAAFTIVLGEGNILLFASEANTRVAAGRNGSSWDTFSPHTVLINAGDSVTWYNPTPVAEPHTVAFITIESYFPPLSAPFSMPNNTEIAPTITNPNVEPITLPAESNNETKTVLMDNARAWVLPGFSPIEEFTVTFEKPGTYEYTCVLHLWMTGSVEVS